MDYCLVSFGGMFAGWTFRTQKISKLKKKKSRQLITTEMGGNYNNKAKFNLKIYKNFLKWI